MSEPREHEMAEEDGATLVTPRFDEEETVLAQPVVRLEAGEELPPDAAPVAPRARAGRHQWPLALILVSALVGSVVGGAGLYFFQKQRRAAAVQPAANPASAEVAQPQPSPTAEQAAEALPESSTPAEAAPVVETAETSEDATRDEEAKPPPVDNDDDERRADRIPTPAPPPAHDTGTPRRGRKAEQEDDRRGRERRTSRDDDAPVPSPSGREARRVDTITYPTRREQRRAERRAARRERRAARNVDRVRAIFEGQPE